MQDEKASKKSRLTKPRCFWVYAFAREGTTPAQANLIFNDFIADPTLPLVLFHDHFIRELGGIAIFYAENAQHQGALFNSDKLHGWKVDIHLFMPIALLPLMPKLLSLSAAIVALIGSTCDVNTNQVLVIPAARPRQGWKIMGTTKKTVHFGKTLYKEI